MDGRTTGEPQVERANFGFTLEHAGLQPDGTFRVAGIVNSYGVMMSGRILHPRGFQRWLKGKNRPATLPMLGNHGLGATGFGTIGEWDRFEHVEGRGMRWSGRVGEKTQLADDARTLLDQKLLKRLSLGWQGIEARWVRAADADVDPYLKEAMTEAGVQEVYAFLSWYPIEASIVDVGDDPGARLAAGSQQAIEAALKPLRTEVAELRESMRHLAVGGGSAVAAALLADVEVRFTSFLDLWRDKVLEMIASDDVFGAAAEELRDLAREYHGQCEGNNENAAGGPTADADIGALLQRVRRRIEG